MGCDVEVEDAPTVMRKHDKHKQNLEPNGRHGEEIDDSQRFPVSR